MTLVVTLVVASLLSAAAYVQSNPVESRTTHDPVALGSHDAPLPSPPSYRLDPDIANNLGAYSARYVVPSRISTSVPSGCNVTMINILQRHGARYPTKGSGAEIITALTKTKAARNISDPALKFASTFNYSYTAEQLVWFGRNQSYISGQIVAKKYAALGTSKFIRTASKERILESSRWWRQGFEGGVFDISIANLPLPDLILSTINNTLAIETCDAAEALDPEPGDIASQKWISVFAPPITQRLNRLLPGANLNNNDTVSLMSLCGFDTAAKNGTASPWCSVFTKDEFKNYEYSVDLEKYYSKSYGSAYARSEGVGWVNELLARLTDKPVRDNTTTNTTLDADIATFPIGASAPKIFADFSSDNNIAMILSATGILRDRVHLPPTGPIPPERQFYVSKIVPFGGSTVVEKLTCSAKGAALGDGDYVRILVNDAVVPLDFPSCGVLGTDSGICSLKGFVESQKFARTGGNWSSCFSRPKSATVSS
ncbi:histidine phosphatase family containing protein [Ceratobasidium sp. AG-Ba]|nr:histidine phosphatase family containing protein [Ceratobasidium sp. AG-Ba]